MADGLSRQQWAHTSMLCALIANANRDPKKTRAFRPDDFDPTVSKCRRSDAIEVNNDTLPQMREAFQNF